MVLQALEDDQPVARCCDLVVEDSEAVGLAEPVRGQLALDEMFCRIAQAFLYLAPADGPQPLPRIAGKAHGILDQQFGKEVRLPRPAPAPCSLVPRRLEQRCESWRCFDAECGQWVGSVFGRIARRGIAALRIGEIRAAVQSSFSTQMSAPRPCLLLTTGRTEAATQATTKR